MAGIIGNQQNVGNAQLSRGWRENTNDASVIPTNMYQDFNNFWQNTPVGGSVDWAGGKLTRNNTNGASVGELTGTFTGADGQQSTVTASTNLSDLARSNAAIGKQWKDQYGFNPDAALGTNTGYVSTPAQTQTGQPQIAAETPLLSQYQMPSGMDGVGTTAAIGNNNANTIAKETYSLPNYSQTGSTSSSVPTTGIISNAQKSSSPNINTDYQNYWKNSQVGQTVDWAGGKLTRNSDGTSTFVSPSGKTQTLTASTNLADLAKSDPSIAAQWVSQYGTGFLNGTNTPMPTATQATADSAATLNDPSKWTITGDQTTQGQLAKLLDPNSPLYQAWATAGKQQAAANGFTGNSTMRDTAMQNSILQNATPIANSDAATFAKAAGYNTDEQNQFGLANMNASNALNLANLSASTQKYTSDQSAATQKAIASMNNESQALISKVHDENSVLINNNSAASTAFNNYAATVANINGSKEMDENAKRTAIETATNIYNAQILAIKKQTPNLSATTSPLDVGDPLSSVKNAVTNIVGPSSPTATKIDDKVQVPDVSHLLEFDSHA